MIKLTPRFTATLDLSASFDGVAALRRLIPLPGGRAIAFGWGTSRAGDCFTPTCWLAEIDPHGVSLRVLPHELSEQIAQLLRRPPRQTHGGGDGIVAFRYGEGVGLLIASSVVHLYADVHAQPRVIQVENHFGDFGSPPYSTWTRDNYFAPETCGHAVDGVVPVVFSEHDDRHALYACRLEIDDAAGQARWRGLDPDGAPRSIVGDQYPRSEDGECRHRLVNGTLVPDYRPQIHACAWTGQEWYLYLAGYHHFHTRFGASPACLTRNTPDLDVREIVYQPQEPSLASICASQDRLVVTPLRKGGPRKGKQSVYLFEQGAEMPLGLPRGCANFVLEDHADGIYWLTAADSVGALSRSVMACEAKG